MRHRTPEHKCKPRRLPPRLGWEGAVEYGPLVDVAVNGGRHKWTWVLHRMNRGGEYTDSEPKVSCLVDASAALQQTTLRRHRAVGEEEGGGTGSVW